MTDSKLEQKREELRHKTFKLMLRVLIIFGIPAIIAYFAGNHLDSTYNMRPYGSLIAIMVALTISWIITFRMYVKLNREFRSLRSAQEKEIEEEEKSI